MYKFGWLKDYPDFRDFYQNGPVFKEALRKLKNNKDHAVDLRKYCSPVEDQGNLGSCTANAAAGMVEFYEKKAFGNFLDASRLFIYKATRTLMKTKGDTGAYLRTTMKLLPILAYVLKNIGRTILRVSIKSFLLSCMPMGKISKALNITGSIQPTKRSRMYWMTSRRTFPMAFQ